MNIELILLLVITAVLVVVYFSRRNNKKKIIEERDQYPQSETKIISPEKDSEDYIDNYWIPVEDTKRKVVAYLKLKYQKTNGEINERSFDVSGFSRGNDGYHIHGYCHKRKKNITLSSLGMKNVIDIESGEVVNDLAKFLEEKYMATSGFIHDSLFDEYGWAIYILIYLSATSGSVVKKERDVIAEFIKSIDNYHALSNVWIDETLKGLYRPGKMEIRNWTKGAINNGKDFSLLRHAFNRLEMVQKKENKEFWTFLKYIEKQLQMT